MKTNDEIVSLIVYIQHQNEYSLKSQDKAIKALDEYCNKQIAADRNKLIKHLAFYYGLPEAEMKKVAEGVK